MALLRTIFYFLLATVFAGVVLLGLWLDVHVLQDKLREVSVTEILQEIILGTIVFLHFRLVKASERMRECNLLIGAFFLAMLIRELDALFDFIAHGSWVWFALMVSIAAIAFAASRYRKTVSQLSVYPQTPYYGMMISGLLCVLVFSRLFGMHSLWDSVLGDQYMRIVKNMVEEGAESFGYTLCLTSSIGYYFYQCRTASQSANASAML